MAKQRYEFTFVGSIMFEPETDPVDVLTEDITIERVFPIDAMDQIQDEVTERLLRAGIRIEGGFRVLGQEE